VEYKCPVCSFVAENEASLLEHQMKTHAASEPEKFFSG